MTRTVNLLVESADSILTSSFVEPLSKLDVSLHLVEASHEVDPKADLTVVWEANHVGAKFNQHAFEHGLAWLPVQYSTTKGRIGPIIVPGQSACYECCLLRLTSNGQPELPQVDKKFELAYGLFVHVVALEVVKWLSRDTNSFVPTTLNHMLELDAFQLEGEVNPVYRVPSCKTCGVGNDPHQAVQSWFPKELVFQ